jgi:hypothetical protein
VFRVPISSRFGIDGTVRSVIVVGGAEQPLVDSGWSAVTVETGCRAELDAQPWRVT